MRRRALHSADAEISQRVSALSEQLLTLEGTAFADIAYRFGTRAERAKGALGGGDLLAHLDLALVDSVAVSQGLIRASVDLAASSIAYELAVVEQTLGARHRGSALSGAIGGRLAEHQLVREASGTLTSGLDRMREGFVIQLRKQRSLAQDPEELALRIFSPERVNLRGLGGRGIWYRPVGWLQAQARTSSLWAVSQVRLEAMAGMNLA